MYIEEGITEINTITDSPSSQYRNVNAFWLMAQLCKKYGVVLNWIYLEAGHGKGLPNGIGGSVKRAMKDSVAFTPEKAWNCLDDFMVELPQMLPYIMITTYERKDILEMVLPKLKSVTDSNACHEVNFFMQNESVMQTMRKLLSEPGTQFSFKVKLDGKRTKKKKVQSCESKSEGELEEDEEDGDEEDVSHDAEESEEDTDFGISIPVNDLDNGQSGCKVGNGTQSSLPRTNIGTSDTPIVSKVILST